MTSLFTASRQHFTAPRGFHTRAKAVRFVATAHFWLKGAFRQRILLPLPGPLDLVETCSVVDAANTVKEASYLPVVAQLAF